MRYADCLSLMSNGSAELLDVDVSHHDGVQASELESEQVLLV